jgi:hypothetical protein
MLLVVLVPLVVFLGMHLVIPLDVLLDVPLDVILDVLLISDKTSDLTISLDRGFMLEVDRLTMTVLDVRLLFCDDIWYNYINYYHVVSLT